MLSFWVLTGGPGGPAVPGSPGLPRRPWINKEYKSKSYWDKESVICLKNTFLKNIKSLWKEIFQNNHSGTLLEMYGPGIIYHTFLL